jgi:hypothetical protein
MTGKTSAPWSTSEMHEGGTGGSTLGSWAPLAVIAKITKGLTEDQKTQLWHFLNSKYENVFDGTLGNWKGTDYRIELRDEVKPYHARPYSVPRAY